MDKQDKCCHKHVGSGPDAVYGLGLIGALVYFMQHVSTFWDVVIGFGKSIIWPALLVYKFLELYKI
jgi:hypothetical protein